ncbi:hypothetical protein [Pseudobacillus badius]|uniref:hypothetical protein n=1 Tax=Bacillus badius TaxID=1455 RepID=UPI0007B3A009|nr:hypothetical protein [Bacillus badius]KZR57915.1 hypothetical protein A3781_19250 [Bacillus badius]
MKKLGSFLSVSIIVAAFIAVAVLSNSRNLNYQGKVQPIATIEEKIEDSLEKENPGKDLEVEITEESNNKK